jgi:ketosteroid isomerase-like protein
VSREQALARIDAARRVLDAMRTGEVSAANDAMHADVEWYGSVGGLEPGLARGREQVRAAFEAYRAAWARLSFDEEAVIVSGDQVLMLVRESAQGMGSGAEVRQASAGLMTVREGRVAHVVTYVDRGRALSDLGVAEGEAAAIRPGRSYELVDGRLVELAAT